MGVLEGKKRVFSYLKAKTAKREFHTLILIICICSDGLWLKNLLFENGINTEGIEIDPIQKTGRAIIQVSAKSGENAIVLYKGANHYLPSQVMDAYFEKMQAAGALQADVSWLVLQGEVNLDACATAIQSAKDRQFIICLNPAPFSPDLPFKDADVLVLNENELLATYSLLLRNCIKNMDIDVQKVSEMANAIINFCDNLKIVVVTLGSEGAIACTRSFTLYEKVVRKVNVVDTTGAGDTFTGFFLTSLTDSTVRDKFWSDLTRDRLSLALQTAIVAAGLCCESKGAISSIPKMDQVKAKLHSK